MNMVTNTRVFFLVKTPQVTVPDNIEAGLAGREGDLVCVQTPARPQQKQNSKEGFSAYIHARNKNS